jgi:hypothetical protein
MLGERQRFLNTRVARVSFNRFARRQSRRGVEPLWLRCAGTKAIRSAATIENEPVSGQKDDQPHTEPQRLPAKRWAFMVRTYHDRATPPGEIGQRWARSILSRKFYKFFRNFACETKVRLSAAEQRRSAFICSRALNREQ